jgi:hypothetical protein
LPFEQRTVVLLLTRSQVCLRHISCALFFLKRIPPAELFDEEKSIMLWTILAVLLVLWLLGLIGGVGGSLIHLLLVVALVLLVVQLLTGRRTVV